ncbi:MAG: UDP-2,4-diacetamido-2,4,6-trideoxy-beta-L-altropyranose hydrolase [Lachnospiraceae bacterium]|nr:UDP-2,4-diacetamido-2,4,6-trideoxy-beta-L-altropyranose hydrolase [Lachnospiraceae bacterium]
MIFIRTDANEEIATGHMMRCLTIAKKLKENGKTVEFLISDENSKTLLENSSFKYTILNTEWDNLDSDIEIAKTKEILLHEQNPVLLVDSYYVSNKYFKSLKSCAKIIAFDDFFEEKIDVDIVINYSIFHDMYDYKSRYADTGTIVLVGPKYVPLREQFSKEKKKRNYKKDKYEVMLMSGGGDKHHVLSGLMSYGDIMGGFANVKANYNVIAGAYNTDIEIMNYTESRFSEVKIYENVEDIATLMEKCDILVSAASTVLYEACAMGIPTIFYCMSDDQKNDIKYFVRDAGYLYVGDVRKDKDFNEKVFLAIKDLMANENLRREICKKSMSLVDGLGAQRIAEEISGL